MKSEEKWLINFELARKYYEKFGHLNIKTDITIDGVKIGTWLSTQKHLYKKGKLSKEKILKLEDIGIVWNNKNKYNGMQFNDLKVIEFSHKEKNINYYKCECICGKEVITTINKLKSGQVKSCGCMLNKNK